MRLSLIRVGNSRGIRIPKAIIEECELGNEVNLEVKDGALVITATGRVRSGWEAAFRKMSDRGDDGLMDGAPESDWDASEWEWK